MCPTCGVYYGFHDDAKHALARDRIPARLTWRKTATGHTDETPVWEKTPLTKGWIVARERETGPSGLCDNMNDHGPHQHEGKKLGRFVCRGRIAGIDRREWEKLAESDRAVKWNRRHDYVCHAGKLCSRHKPLEMIRR